MDIIQLVEEIEDLIENAGAVPFSKKVMIDADELYDIIHDMRQNLPEEIKQANWVTEERDRILDEARLESENIISGAQGQADSIINSARDQANQMVGDHEIVAEAREKAQSIQANAEQAARNMQLQSIAYVDDILAKSQENLHKVMSVIEENRDELRKN